MFDRRRITRWVPLMLSMLPLAMIVAPNWSEPISWPYRPRKHVWTANSPIFHEANVYCSSRNKVNLLPGLKPVGQAWIVVFHDESTEPKRYQIDHRKAPNLFQTNLERWHCARGDQLRHEHRLKLNRPVGSHPNDWRSMANPRLARGR